MAEHPSWLITDKQAHLSAIKILAYGQLAISTKHEVLNLGQKRDTAVIFSHSVELVT